MLVIHTMGVELIELLNSEMDAILRAEGLTRERVRQVIAGALQKLRDDPVVAAYGAAVSP